MESQGKARVNCLADPTIKTMRFTHTPQGGKEILRGTPNNVTGEFHIHSSVMCS